MNTLLIFALIGLAAAVEVHFENNDGGFFIKHVSRWNGAISQSDQVVTAPQGSLLSLDRFTVLRTAQPVSVRATYGPFSTKQTVPARYGVPDPLEAPTAHENKNSTAALIEFKDAKLIAPHRLDVSAHVVCRELARDSPNLRVLFHAGSEANSRRLSTVRNHRICISVHATYGARTLTSSCSPDGEEGACLAELSIPADWWPGETKGKRPPRIVKLAYSAAESESDGVNPVCNSKITVQPAWSLGTVTLVPARAGWRDVKAGHFALLTPRASLYPHSRFHLPFVLKKEVQPQVSHIIVKMRVKAGLRLISAVPTNARWHVMVELKSRVATVTVTRRKSLVDDDEDNYDSGPWEELFSFLLEVGTDAGRSAARLSWSAKNVASRSAFPDVTASPTDNLHPRITTRFDVEKDDIQAVLPISKNWEVLNTAVLTGHQVSQGMKVLIVSQSGQVADVTRQSACHSEDESVLKVSSSCSSVYVDGSEIRGSANASVIVKYSTYTGLAKFTVWMPEFPLDIDVNDTRLSQIKGWKVLDEDAQSGKNRMRRSYAIPWPDNDEEKDVANNVGDDNQKCRFRYQQSPVEVYARFLATDHDSGRVTYFVSRRTWLKVTDLVASLMRVSDPRIASLHGRVLRGRSMGRTEVQVLSPITGRVIGAKEVRVVNDKVTIAKLLVRVISGLQLNISPDSALENGYISETTITRRLTAQYQEGLLDIDIEFSDGLRTPLRNVPITDYFLLVETLDPEVVAFAPMVASHHPRVIAVGEGHGEMLRVSLFTPDSCRPGPIRKLTAIAKGDNSKNLPGLLATASAKVEVDFTSGDMAQRPDALQNDDIASRRADMGDILMRFPLKDEIRHEPTIQARQHGKSMRGISVQQYGAHMSSLEIGMYVLLAVFCCGILIFVISCVVYASKLKPVNSDIGMHTASTMPVQPTQNGKVQVAGLVGASLGFSKDKSPRESTDTANDWIWLGRATLERNGNHPVNGNQVADNHEIRITNNPLNYNYLDPDDAIRTGHTTESSVDNGNTNSPDGGRRVIDSTTYCKRPLRNNIAYTNGNEVISRTEPAQGEEYKPPLPPHNAPLRRNSKPVLAETIMPPVRRGHKIQSRKIEHETKSPVSHKPPDIKRLIKRIESELAASSANRPEHLQLENIEKPQSLVDKMAAQNDCLGMFAFDADAPPPMMDNDLKDIVDCKRTFTKPQSPDCNSASGIGFPEVQMRRKHIHGQKRECVAIDDDFVEVLVEKNGETSPEVKRATIIGNPMFSTRHNEMKPEEERSNETLENKVDDGADSLSLADLQMDYDQIMSYFHNLKESNA